MSTTAALRTDMPPTPRSWIRRLLPGVFAWRPLRMVERNAFAYRRMWLVLVAGMTDPILYLLSVGLGVGALVGDLPGPDGAPISYQRFVAPGLLAMAAMSGSIIDTTFTFFVKYKYLRTYDAILATPMRVLDVAAGEIAWTLLRGSAYACVFLGTMLALGLVESWWAVVAIPAAALIGFAFAGVGLAATTWMRSFVDFDHVNLAIVPMFLFSGTFFPLARYPDALEWVVQATPLYQGVELVRSLVLGDIRSILVLHALYLAVMGWIGIRITRQRLGRRLQP